MDFRRVLFAFLALWGLLHVAADDAIPSTKVATHVSTTSLSQETPASDDEALRAVHPSQQYCPRNEYNHDYDHGAKGDSTACQPCLASEGCVTTNVAFGSSHEVVYDGATHCLKCAGENALSREHANEDCDFSLLEPCKDERRAIKHSERETDV